MLKLLPDTFRSRDFRSLKEGSADWIRCWSEAYLDTQSPQKSNCGKFISHFGQKYIVKVIRGSDAYRVLSGCGKTVHHVVCKCYGNFLQVWHLLLRKEWNTCIHTNLVDKIKNKLRSSLFLSVNVLKLAFSQQLITLYESPLWVKSNKNNCI